MCNKPAFQSRSRNSHTCTKPACFCVFGTEDSYVKLLLLIPNLEWVLHLGFTIAHTYKSYCFQWGESIIHFKPCLNKTIQQGYFLRINVLCVWNI